jgi:hypothetical protein
MKKRKSPNSLLYVIISIVIIATATAVLLYGYQAGILNGEDSQASQPQGNRAQFDAFAGYSRCESAIRGEVSDTIITFESDDRTASYNRYNDTNEMTYRLKVAPKHIDYRSQPHSTYGLVIQCTTSAKNNQVMNLKTSKVDPRLLSGS